jgi:hypothetical protein
VLRVDGDIDACIALQLRKLVMDLAGNGTIPSSRAGGVGFSDSAGVGAW